MSDPLTRAIRCRNLYQATNAIAHLQEHMSSDRIRDRILAVVERLAWEEGDRSAATWLLRHAACRSRQ